MTTVHWVRFFMELSKPTANTISRDLHSVKVIRTLLLLMLQPHHSLSSSGFPSALPLPPSLLLLPYTAPLPTLPFSLPCYFSESRPLSPSPPPLSLSHQPFLLSFCPCHRLCAEIALIMQHHAHSSLQANCSPFSVTCSCIYI